MNPPARVVVAGYPYEIELVTDPNIALDRHMKPSTFGVALMGAGRIRLRSQPESSPHNQRDTLLHELIHIVLTFGGYLDGEKDVFKTDRMAERVVDVLATHLLDTFRRNPALVAYLMEGDSDAAQAGQVTEDDQRQHQGRNQSRPTAEAGARDRAAKSGQAEEVNRQ